MAISYVGAGAFGTGTSSATVATPAGSLTDIVLSLVGNKPYTSSPTISGFTEQITQQSGAVANGNGVGSVRATCLRQTTPTTGTGSHTVNVTSGSPTMGIALRFASSIGGTWSVFSTAVSDGDETGTTVNALTANTSHGNPPAGSFRSGDWIVLAVVIKDDVPTHTSQTFTVPGCTVGTITWLAKQSTTTGNDGTMYLGYAEITAGTSTESGLTYSATSSVSGASATAVTVTRLREALVHTPTDESGRSDSFTASLNPPRVDSLSRAYDLVAGGASTTITGANFTGATSVTFGGAAATSFNVVNSTTITATIPAGSLGQRTVVVTTAAGSSNSFAGFHYVPPFYVVPGTGNIDSTPARWAGGALPTSADDVYLGVLTPDVTLQEDLSCRSFDCTGFTGLITMGGNATLSIGHSTVRDDNIAVLLNTTMWISSGTNRFIDLVGTNATEQYCYWAAETTSPMTVRVMGAGGSWAFSLFSSAALVHTAGTLHFVTDASFASFTTSGNTTRSLVIDPFRTMSAATGGDMTASGSNLTVTAASTSLIQFSGSSVIDLGGFDWDDLRINLGTTASTDRAGGISTQIGNGTLGTLYLSAAGASRYVGISGDLTVGTFMPVGESATNRLTVASTRVGTPRTITAGALANTAFVDFADITAAGASAPWTSAGVTGGIGDKGGNSSITASIPMTCYAVMTADSAWTTNSVWKTTSGGSTVARVPLAQDDVVIDAASGAWQLSLTAPRTLGKNVTFAGWTGSTSSSAPIRGEVFGNYTAPDSTAIADGIKDLIFSGVGSHTINVPSGVEHGGDFEMCAAGTYTLTGDLIIDNDGTGSPGTFRHYAGTLDLDTKTLGAKDYSCPANTDGPVVLDTGTGTVLLSPSTGTFWSVASADFSCVGAGTISLVHNTGVPTATYTFAGGNYSYPTVDLRTEGGHTGTVAITGNNTFAHLKAGDTTSASTLRFTSGTTTTVAGWTVDGPAASQLTINASVSNSAFYLVYTGAGNLISNDVTVVDSIASPINTWYALSSSLTRTVGWYTAIPTHESDHTDGRGLTDSHTTTLGGGGAALTRTDDDNRGLTDAIVLVVTYSRVHDDSQGRVDTRTLEQQYTVTPDDSLGQTDTSTRETAYVRSHHDALGSVDVHAAGLVVTRTHDDSQGLADETVRATSFARTYEDVTGSADDRSQVLTYNRSHDDGLGLLDTPSTATVMARTHDDSTGLVDTHARETGYALVRDDTLGLTDLSSTASTFAGTHTDSAGLADLSSALAAFGYLATDPTGLVDTTTRTTTFASAFSDSSGSTDTASLAAAFAGTHTDTLGETDASTQVTTLTSDHSDSTGLVDAATAATAVSVTFSESSGSTDSASATAIYGRSHDDTTSLLDTAAVATAFGATHTDERGLLDTATSAAVFAPAYTDGVERHDRARTVLPDLADTFATATADLNGKTLDGGGAGVWRPTGLNETGGTSSVIARTTAGTLRSNTTARSQLYYIDEVAPADVAVTAAYVATAPTASYVTLMARYNLDGSAIIGYLVNGVTFVITALQAGGGATVLGFFVAERPAAGSTHYFELRTVGTLAAIAYDGQTVLTVENTLVNPASGHIGAGGPGSSNFATQWLASAAIGDALDLAAGFDRSHDDPTGLQDTNAPTTTFDRAHTDPLGSADTTTTAAGAVNAHDDPTSLTDTATTTTSNGPSHSNDTGLTDTSSQVLAADLTLTDHVGHTDTTSTTSTATRTHVDQVALTDTATLAATLTLTLTDTTSLADTTTKTSDLSSTHDDHLQLTDTSTAAQVATVIAEDPLGHTDTPSTAQTGVLTCTDNRDLTDTSDQTATAAGAHVDPAGLSDTVSTQGTFSSTQPDGTGLSDAFQTAVTYQLALADITGSTDAATASSGVTLTTDDTTSLSDIAAASSARSSTHHNPTGLTDVLSGTAARAHTAHDVAGVTDQTLSAAARNASITDDRSTTDSTSTALDRARSHDDQTDLTDLTHPVRGTSLAAADTTLLTDTTDRQHENELLDLALEYNPPQASLGASGPRVALDAGPPTHGWQTGISTVLLHTEHPVTGHRTGRPTDDHRSSG